MRGTRHVQITPDGQTLLRAVEPLLAKLDASVQQHPPLAQPPARQRHDLRVVRLALAAAADRGVPAQHPDIDIRVSAHDALADLDDPELDLALRYCSPAQAPAGGVHMFDETLTPAVSRSLWEQIQAGDAPPLAEPADLAQPHAAEEDDDRASTEFLSWRHWLALPRPAEPRSRERWLYLNFTYQQVQAALAGHGVALARVPLVFEALQRGELVEPFGEAGRIRARSRTGCWSRRAAAPGPRWRSSAPGSRPRRRRRATRSAPCARRAELGRSATGVVSERRAR